MATNKSGYGTIQTILRRIPGIALHLLFPPRTTSTTENDWECDLDKFFQRAILTKFNPLKFCDETVVYIFAKLATKLNVCYCYPSSNTINARECCIQTHCLPQLATLNRNKSSWTWKLTSHSIHWSCPSANPSSLQTT